MFYLKKAMINFFNNLFLHTYSSFMYKLNSVTREKGATVLNCDCYIFINHRKYYSDNISYFSSILFHNG